MAGKRLRSELCGVTLACFAPKIILVPPRRPLRVEVTVIRRTITLRFLL